MGSLTQDGVGGAKCLEEGVQNILFRAFHFHKLPHRSL